MPVQEEALRGGQEFRWSGQMRRRKGGWGGGNFFRQAARLDFFFFEYCNLAVVKVLICQVLQGQNRKSNDVRRVGGFTTNSKPIVKICATHI
jgi:hypothetical protein